MAAVAGLDILSLTGGGGLGSRFSGLGLGKGDNLLVQGNYDPIHSDLEANYKPGESLKNFESAYAYQSSYLSCTYAP